MFKTLGTSEETPTWHSRHPQAISSPVKNPKTELGTIRLPLDTMIDEAAGSISGANCANSAVKL
jgi:hypothetical protein